MILLFVLLSAGLGGVRPAVSGGDGPIVYLPTVTIVEPAAGPGADRPAGCDLEAVEAALSSQARRAQRRYALDRDETARQLHHLRATVDEIVDNLVGLLSEDSVSPSSTITAASMDSEAPTQTTSAGLEDSESPTLTTSATSTGTVPPISTTSDILRRSSPATSTTSGSVPSAPSTSATTGLITPTPTSVPGSDDPRDCSDVLASGSVESSVYVINPTNISLAANAGPLRVYCDMETDGGGWTVFQRRQDGSVDFYLSAVDYFRGFGSPDGEFWLGNEYLHLLTDQGDYQLRVELEDFEGNTVYALYDSFSVAGILDSFRLSVGEYSGTAGDSLSNHDGKMFTFKNLDKDDWEDGNCAHEFRGAWWYAACYKSNLNGAYHGIKYEGISWYAWKNNYEHLRKTEMKIRRKEVVSPRSSS